MSVFEVSRTFIRGFLRQPHHPQVVWNVVHRTNSTASNQLSLIKKLRDQTGAPISDVKKALEQAGWNMESASQELRKKGLSVASKKASRSATEGLVGLASKQDMAAIVEINSETDFVARNEMFTALVASAAQSLVHSAVDRSKAEIPLDLLKAVQLPNGVSLEDSVKELAGNVRENIQLRRGCILSAVSGNNGLVGTYLHGAAGPGVGRIAAAVLLESPSEEFKDLDPSKLKIVQDVAHKLAMHVVGSIPRYLRKEDVPKEALDSEREILLEQALKSGKPKNIVEKMVDGRLKKFYDEVCLLEQPFVMDDRRRVSDIVQEISKKIGLDLSLSHFLRIQVGEGMSQDPKKDFASEVADTLASA